MGELNLPKRLNKALWFFDGTLNWKGCCEVIKYSSPYFSKGLGLLTLSALLSSLANTDCQTILFFFALYLVAVAQGGHRPCVQAFGADQFDEDDRDKSSFFNWWFCCTSGAVVVSLFILSYIQDNLSWVLGFGIPCIVMVLALVVFLLGTKTYRFSVTGSEENPFVRIGRVFITAAKNCRTTSISNEIEAGGFLLYQASEQFKFLNKALLLPPDCVEEYGKVCRTSEVEEAKQVLRLVPIWATSLLNAVVASQIYTFFTKQGVTLDRKISPSFEVPPAMLQCITFVAVVIFTPIYDRIIVPLAKVITKKPAGITMLQRIGIGMILSTLSIFIAALVEKKRLKTARDHGLIDFPNVTLPMSIWWMIPQYFLFGVADVFTLVGLQEFFYSQVPNEMRSVGLSLYLSILGVGSLLSSFLVSSIDNITSGNDGHSWFSDNLNKAHLDYYYLLLSVLGGIGLAAYVYFAKSYVYSRGK
ncbi:hypothetical protein ACFE04_012279 [Oxalis oulophora]